MAERALRFGAAGSAGLRAESWKCWGTSKKDVYIACRALGTLHFSLHASGRWHVAFDSKQFPTMFEEGAKPSNRFSGQWARPAPIVDGLTLACRIHTPWHAVTIKDEALDPKVSWVEPAPRGQSVEFAVFLSDRPVDPEGWPGRISLGTKAIGWFELEGGGSVWIVHRNCPTINPSLPPMPAPNYFRGKGEHHLLGANRALLWGVHDDGYVIIQETPVVVKKNERS